MINWAGKYWQWIGYGRLRLDASLQLLPPVCLVLGGGFRGDCGWTRHSLRYSDRPQFNACVDIGGEATAAGRVTPFFSSMVASTIQCRVKVVWRRLRLDASLCATFGNTVFNSMHGWLLGGRRLRLDASLPGAVAGTWFGGLGGGPNLCAWCLGTVDCGWTRPSERNLATAVSIQCMCDDGGRRLRLDASLPWQLLENLFGGLGGGSIDALSGIGPAAGRGSVWWLFGRGWPRLDANPRLLTRARPVSM
jgi:hypothetical protein